MNLKKTRMYNLESLVAKIKEIVSIARDQVAYSVNNELLITYWEIGHQIVEHEQKGELRAKYGEKLLIELSKQLTKSLSKGYSRSNLQNMRALYLAYPKRQTVSGKLSWSHYCELISIEDPHKRAFYENETINARWSVRELQRQLDSSLFERLLLSKGEANKGKSNGIGKTGAQNKQSGRHSKRPLCFRIFGHTGSKTFS